MEVLHAYLADANSQHQTNHENSKNKATKLWVVALFGCDGSARYWHHGEASLAHYLIMFSGPVGAFCSIRRAALPGPQGLYWQEINPHGGVCWIPMTLRNMINQNTCPCGSNLGYHQCCRVWHAGAAPDDAPRLMRSRYSAYVLRNEAYLLDTWHPRTRPGHISFDPQQRWLGLRVIEATVTGDATADVVFIARYRIGGATAARLHERSRFVRDGGRWFYLDGDVLE